LRGKSHRPKKHGQPDRPAKAPPVTYQYYSAADGADQRTRSRQQLYRRRQRQCV
jgi:hypothetical protein